MTGIEMTHIPYKGTAQAMNDVIAGHVPLIFSDLAPAIPLLKDGKLRALGISSAVRFSAPPGMPPPAASSAPGFDAASSRPKASPPGTPPRIAATLPPPMDRIMRPPARDSTV